MRGGEVLLDAAQVDRRRRGGGAKGLPVDLAAESVLLQVVKARSALDIGHGLGGRLLQPLEHLAARKRPLELPHEFLEVMLHHAVQVHQLAVDVVDDLDVRRRRPQEVQRRAAAENLDVALMGWEQRNQTINEATLAADPGNDGG